MSPRTRFACAAALLAAPLLGQAPLTQLEQAATSARAEWTRLAADLDVRVARLLPCDPAATAAIEDANRASNARFETLGAYLNGVLEQASRDTATAREIQRAEAAALTGAGTERIDTEQERARIQTQFNNLTESVRRKVTLTTATFDLRALEELVRTRSDLAARAVASSAANQQVFEDLAVALEQRETALRKQLPALESERTAWNGYYTARLARARTECAVTNPGR